MKLEKCQLSDIEMGFKTWVYFTIFADGKPANLKSDTEEIFESALDSTDEYYYCTNCGEEWKTWDKCNKHLTEQNGDK